MSSRKAPPRSPSRTPSRAPSRTPSRPAKKPIDISATGVVERGASPRPADPASIILVVDVGGTHIKVRASDWPELVRIDSGPNMGASQMVDAVRELVGDRRYDVVAMGYPGPVKDGQPAREPVNLGPGWVGFDYAAAFGAPVRTINDAAMQALGNFAGGHMLFIGYGTGMGSAFVTDLEVLPLELAHAPYRKGRTYEEYVGAAGRERMGDRKWRKHCLRVACILRDAMQASDVVLGGGNAKRLDDIPEGMRIGSPDAAFKGGLELWARQAAPITHELKGINDTTNGG